ncbi:hypothetical protein VNO80_14978 [Phaseolus coccineus]|uniref:J domain-containing protein n=1 Tax=Phaseolus coccineus TaxID=3886 RepID=A0AAN9MQH4_PHACN
MDKTTFSCQNDFQSLPSIFLLLLILICDIKCIFNFNVPSFESFISTVKCYYVLAKFYTVSQLNPLSVRVPAKQNPIPILHSFLEDFSIMTTPLMAGIAVAAAAYAGRYGIQAWQAFKARPPSMRRFYEGGFQATMTRREAALILGVRERTPTDKIKEAHRRVMVANHPDAGGSHYLASKINEAKDMLLGKTKGGGSAF